MSARTSTGPWWYAHRNRFNGRWAFNHRGRRFFAPIDWGPDDYDKAVAWHTQEMAAIDPGYTGPKPPRTTVQGDQQLAVRLSRECLALLDRLRVAYQARDLAPVVRLAVARLDDTVDMQIEGPVEEPAARKTFNVPPWDLEIVQGLAKRYRATQSQILEFAVRRLAEQVSQNGSGAVLDTEAEGQEPVVEEEVDGQASEHESRAPGLGDGQE